MPHRALAVAAVLVLSIGGARAADLTAAMRKTSPSGPGESLGTVTIVKVDGGSAFKFALHGLPPGPHGFHVHANGSCAPSEANGQVVPAGAAGGHFDPDHTGKHLGPEQDGHLGDLPALVAEPDGTATGRVVAPRIADPATLKGHALMIHVGGDNYEDTPLPLGGGGARYACGVIE